MKESTISGQVFSIAVALIFVSSAYLILIEEAIDEEYEMRVPVWARSQFNYDTYIVSNAINKLKK